MPGITRQNIQRFFASATGRLTLSYLAIIMVMSIGFSVVFYHTSARELNRPAGISQAPVLMQRFEVGERAVSTIEDILQERAAEGRRRLMTNLVLLNIGALVAGSYISYLLARRSLEPIEAVMEAQSRFTSDASHELRTPLAAIQAENEVALRKSNLTLERAKELLRSNLEEAAKLRDLSEGLLQLARADHTDIELRPVSLPQVATEALNRVIKLAQDKNIAIEDTVPALTAQGDKRLLTQALIVLLDNAIKYSPSNTTVKLQVSQDTRQAIIQVIDQGPGINASQQAHIFDRFYRADQSRSRQNVAGYGLGLSIARKIILQHQGSLSVQSTPGEGATFTVKLPLANPSFQGQALEN